MNMPSAQDLKLMRQLNDNQRHWIDDLEQKRAAQQVLVELEKLALAEGDSDEESESMDPSFETSESESDESSSSDDENPSDCESDDEREGEVDTPQAAISTDGPTECSGAKRLADDA